MCASNCLTGDWEEMLDKLEGIIAEDKEDICLIFEKDKDIHDTLARHAGFWRESGANEFAVSVIDNGCVPQMWDHPQNYEE